MKNITTTIIDAIKSSTDVLVCGHIRPDGDCVGSALAMRRICRNLGKFADAVCDVDDFASFLFLPDRELFCKPRKEYYDLFIAVDCATESRLGKYKNNLVEAKNSIYIDHHPGNTGYAEINCLEPAASSTCAIIYELFEGTGLIDKETATMLYTGLSTDTGHFMHANTDARVFEIAAELCRLGVDVAEVNHGIYCDVSKNKLKLTARTLEGMRFYEGGKIALITITQNDLAECGCTTEDTEGLIDNATSVHGVQISIAVCEQQGNMCRVSLRSVQADVSKVANKFGGGGHKLASGCIISGACETVVEKIAAAAASAL